MGKRPSTQDKIFSIISDKTLQAPEMKDKKEQMIMEAVEGAFNWEEFSKRALAKHWSKKTDSEKKEFISLLKELIKRTYMEKSGQYSGGKVEFLEEKIDGEYGVVNIPAGLIKRHPDPRGLSPDEKGRRLVGL